MSGELLSCPSCGNEDVGSADLIPGTAEGCWILNDKGHPQFEGSGNTVVHWDGQQNIAEEGEPEEAYCRECDWNGPVTKLVQPQTSLPGMA
jgi:hypothetical protein